jgi:hypothetical protein
MKQKINLKKILRENLNEVSVNNLKKRLQNVIDSSSEKIDGKILTSNEVKKLEQEIKNNYSVNSSEMFNKEKDDIRQKLFNYDNPIINEIINGVEIRIAEGLIKNKRKTYLLYANGDIIGEFYSFNHIKTIIKTIINKINQTINESLIDQNNKLIDLTQSDINEILKGYIESALWTEEEQLRDEATKKWSSGYMNLVMSNICHMVIKKNMKRCLIPKLNTQQDFKYKKIWC